MKLVILIPTYNREESLFSLLAQIDAQRGDRDISVFVLDDCTPSGCDKIRTWCNERAQWTRFWRTEVNRGRKRFWQTFTELMQSVRFTNHDTFLFIQDDQELCENFFTKLETFWNTAKSTSFAMLYEMDRRNTSLESLWGSVRSRSETINGKPWIRQGWVDCKFVCDRRFLDAVKYEISPMPDTRWKQLDVSSGVGQHLTTSLKSMGKTALCSPQSLTRHNSVPSVMYPNYRAAVPLVTERFVDDMQTIEHVTASIATHKKRLESLKVSVESLLPQVNRLNVYLNDFSVVPDFLHDPKIFTIVGSKAKGDLADNAKFYFVKDAKGIQLACDDDIIYPADYAQRMVEELEKIGRRGFICVHGSTISEPVTSYYQSRRSIHFGSALSKKTAIHVPGTGTLAWDADAVKLSLDDFLGAPLMADIWLGIYARKNNLPIYAIERSLGWLKPIGNQDDGIFASQKDNGHLQTALVKMLSPWPKLVATT